MPLNIKPSSGSGSITLQATTGTTTNDTLTLPASTGTVALTASPTFTGTTTTGAQSVGGNITFSAADAGIIFNKTGALTNSTLNDYEVGTWTPTIAGLTTAGSCSYSSQVGTYTKVGSIVAATFDIQTSSTPTGTGFAAVNGLPFACNSSTQAALEGGPFYYANIAASWYVLGGYGDGAQTRIILIAQTSAAGSIQYINPNVFTSGARIFGVAVYRSNT